jgi:hypothetical protein
VADRIDESGERFVHDDALGGHAVCLDAMERSANRYLLRRGDLPRSIPDDEVGVRVADHINRTSEGIRLMREHYVGIGRPELFDSVAYIALIDSGTTNPAAAYAPSGYVAVYDGASIRFLREPA